MAQMILIELKSFNKRGKLQQTDYELVESDWIDDSEGVNPMLLARIKEGYAHANRHTKCTVQCESSVSPVLSQIPDVRILQKVYVYIHHNQ